MNMDLHQVKVIPANKKDDLHKKAVWKIFNENIGYNLVTTKKVSYKQHCKWWDKIFQKEYVYLILYNFEICGYIRLSKKGTNSREINEISIALSKKFQTKGIGSVAYKLFEKEMKQKGINRIIALTDIKNIKSQKFFEKNSFKKAHIRYVKEI